MSERPAEIVGLDDQGRPIEVGEPANLALVDPDAEWTVAGPDLASRSDNTPVRVDDAARRGDETMLRGRVTARDGKSPRAECERRG